MDILSALAIAFIGFLLGLVTTLVTTFLGLIGIWYGARVNKSTDTRTQLLVKMDDWINEIDQFCTSAYFKIPELGKSNVHMGIELFEKFSHLAPGRYIGVARALNLKSLDPQLTEFNSIVVPFIFQTGDMLQKFRNPASRCNAELSY